MEVPSAARHGRTRGRVAVHGDDSTTTELCVFSGERTVWLRSEHDRRVQDMLVSWCVYRSRMLVVQMTDVERNYSRRMKEDSTLKLQC